MSSTPRTSSSPSPAHLDRTLFWLRWLFALSALVLALAADGAWGDWDNVRLDRLAVCAVIVAAVNGGLGALATLSRGGRWLGALTLLLDILLAVVFFWAYDGAILPFLVFGALAALVAGFRFGRQGWLASLVLLVLSSGIVLTQLPKLTTEQIATWAAGLALLAALGGVSSEVGSRGPQSAGVDPRELEARRLRNARERARALSEMANTLGATLDYRSVLEAAQTIGSLAVHEDLGSRAHVISAVMLFQGKDNKLRIAASRGLTRTDDSVALAGREGVLALALKQAEPVFAGDAVRDPELQYIAAFQNARSVLAIPLRAGYDNYGVMLFGCDRPNAFSNAHRELMEAIGRQATMALQNAVLYRNLLVEKEKIVEVEEDARKKLARDLHDGPTQSVAAIAMRASYIRRLIERQPQQAIQELWKVEDLARRTTKEIRHMLFTLRPLVLETQGLVAALHQLSEKMADTHNTAVTVVAQDDVEKLLDLNAQGVLFYIVEEAVNNARKHAQSSQIWVRLYRREHNYVVVEIEDNGVGFDVDAVTNNYEQRGSLGMVNMHERAELIEATLRVQSAPGVGTKISILIPVYPTGATTTTTSTTVVQVTDDTPPLALQSQRPDRGSVAERLRPAPSASSDTHPSRPSRPIAQQPSPAQQVPPSTSAPPARPMSRPINPPGTSDRDSHPRKPG